MKEVITLLIQLLALWEEEADTDSIDPMRDFTKCLSKSFAVDPNCSYSIKRVFEFVSLLVELVFLLNPEPVFEP